MKVGLINKSSHPNPTYKTPGSSGMDIRANIPTSFFIESGDRVNVSGKTIVKITDTSNDKVQMGFDEVNDATLEGSSAEMVSGVIFTKLGDL